MLLHTLGTEPVSKSQELNILWLCSKVSVIRIEIRRVSLSVQTELDSFFKRALLRPKTSTSPYSTDE
jgi:hypothetical protein